MSTADDAMLQECLQLAQEVAREAGRMIREAHERRADESVKIESKGSLAPGNMSVDLVTETDKACEDYIIGTLKKRFPSHAFIGEESSFAGPNGGPAGPLELTEAPTWIIDPLDGTTNYVHGYPLVTVSIALAVGRELVLGVIHNPLLDQMCSAVVSDEPLASP
jgi:fructose-1,6-bisphosphatase/inositol monophosphatase family enzyme